MNRYLTIAAAAGAAVLALLAAVPGAEARGGREYFVQTYNFDKPMHGYSGRAGNYYCDYQRLPQRQCVVDRSGNESCKVVGWTLRQHCY